MTDVKDPEPRIDAKVADTSARTTLVSRALAPIRRVTGYELAPSSARAMALRFNRSLDIDLETQNFSRIILWSFVLVVLVPMFLSGVYFLFWASDQYVAEARFAVRQADPVSGAQASDEKGGDEKGGGSPIGGSVNLKGQNAEIVASYIKSRAIIDDVARTLNIREIFRRPEADFFAKLPSNASMEDLTTYWGRMISVYIETSSGIVTVSASTFRRDDSLALVQAILASSETLVNSLSTKMRADQTRLAENEVRRSEGEVRFALSDLQSFRNEKHLIDPIKSSESTSKLMMTLMTQRIEAEGQLYVAERVQGPDAPGVASLRAKIDSANAQIKSLQDQLAGNTEATKNMAAVLSRFEQLEIKKRFAERLFQFSQTALERARVAAIRQSIYLSVFVPASLPQSYAYPLRWTDFILISIAGLMIWICGLTVSASILDHRI